MAAPRLGSGPRAADSGPGAQAGRAASGRPWGRGGPGAGVVAGPAWPGPPPESSLAFGEGGREVGAAGPRQPRASGPAGCARPPPRQLPRGPERGPCSARGRSPGGRGEPGGHSPARPPRGQGEARSWAGPPAPRPTLCWCCCWCPGSCHVRRGHEETPVNVSWHSAQRWSACERPGLCQGPQPLPPSGCPTQDLGPWPGPTPQSCKAQRHHGTWLHWAPLPLCSLLPQIRGRVPCCKLVTRTLDGIVSPCAHPPPKHLSWAPTGPLIPHRPCQPWAPTSLDHEPRGLVGSSWQCGLLAHQAHGGVGPVGMGGVEPKWWLPMHSRCLCPPLGV